MERIYLYTGFERLWHWSQAFLIITLMITGFNVHGLYHLIDFEKAVNLHTISAWALISLWAFAIFWHIITGEWKQYVPTAEKIREMAEYYLLGIFRHSPHPFKKTRERKHNPLQKLTYFFILVIVNPIVWVSGWLYLFYNGGMDLRLIASRHVIGAYMLVLFLVAHIYLAMTGKTPTTYLKAMVTGYEKE